jgi:CheY-like chemotaxis protein
MPIPRPVLEDSLDSKLSVLIVDDSPVSRRFARAALEASGKVSVIDEADDGPAALTMMRATVYDIVFCDIRMPTMSGLEVMATLKAEKTAANQKLPMFVFMSTSVSSDTYLEADHLGAFEFLVKPFGAPEVDALLEIYKRLRETLRVLVVDDSHTVLNLVERICQLSTFTLVYDRADSGEAALRKIQMADYDAVFLDVNMPGLNGVQTLSKIKKERPKLKAVLMSSEVLEDVRARAGLLDIDVFLHKPFTPTDFDLVLFHLFGLRPPRLHSKAVALLEVLGNES